MARLPSPGSVFAKALYRQGSRCKVVDGSHTVRMHQLFIQRIGTRVEEHRFHKGVRLPSWHQIQKESKIPTLRRLSIRIHTTNRDAMLSKDQPLLLHRPWMARSYLRCIQRTLSSIAHHQRMAWAPHKCCHLCWSQRSVACQPFAKGLRFTTSSSSQLCTHLAPSAHRCSPTA